MTNPLSGWLRLGPGTVQEHRPKGWLSLQVTTKQPNTRGKWVNYISIRMNTSKKTLPVSLRLPPELKAALTALAEADKRSFSSYVLIALEKHVAEVQDATK